MSNMSASREQIYAKMNQENGDIFVGHSRSLVKAGGAPKAPPAAVHPSGFQPPPVPEKEKHPKGADPTGAL